MYAGDFLLSFTELLYKIMNKEHSFMQIMITDLSLYAKTILEQHSSWTVHSVYRKTINLQSGDLLLALQPDHRSF